MRKKGKLSIIPTHVFLNCHLLSVIRSVVRQIVRKTLSLLNVTLAIQGLKMSSLMIQVKNADCQKTFLILLIIVTYYAPTIDPFQKGKMQFIEDNVLINFAKLTKSYCSVELRSSEILSLYFKNVTKA